MGTQKVRYWKTKLDSLVGSDIKNTSATYSVSICYELIPVQLVHELIIHRHRLCTLVVFMQILKSKDLLSLLLGIFALI